MTFAQALDTLGHMLPFIVGVVLVGGAMAGSRLRPDHRKTIERWVLWPVFVALGAGLAIYGAMLGDWVKVTAGLVALSLSAIRLFTSIRAYRAAKAPTNPKGTGTTA